MDLTYLSIELLLIGLLLHELVYASSYGLSHFQDEISPVFGLHINGRLKGFVHICFSIFIILTIIYGQSIVFLTLITIFLSVLIASFPKRLSNHLILAWFLLISYLIDWFTNEGGLLYSSLGQYFILLLYFFSGFHKLNKSYINPKISCGKMVVIHYLYQKKFIKDTVPKWVYPLSVYFIIAIEIFAPIFLLYFGNSNVLLVYILLHVAFGFLAHIHFSTIMFSGLITFLTPHTSDFVIPFSGLTIFGLGVVGFMLGIWLGNHVAYKNRAAAVLGHGLFGSISLLIFAYVFSENFELNSDLGHIAMSYPAIILSILFLVNCLSPYIGLKQDFSFAMFSNLRPDNWDHIIVKRRIFNIIPTYIQVLEFKIYNADKKQRNIIKTSLENRFIDMHEQKYTLNYATSVVSTLEKKFGIKIKIICNNSITNDEIIISSDYSKFKFIDKFSVFPYQLPINKESTLCH